MSSATDLEKGQGAQAAPPRADQRVGPTNTALPAREAQTDVSQPETLDEISSSAYCCIPSGVLRPFTSIRGGSNTDHSKHNINDTTGDQPTQAGQSPSQAEAQINPASEQKSEEPRMIGDFDGSANEFWKLYGDEAESHDKIRIDTLKNGMDSAGIFAGLFSAVLTAFVVDRKQDLKLSPAEETMVYYLRQHSMILSQISVQLSSIAPQVSIPSTPPPSPVFNPSPSDVRVNAFWFMALVFSLLAALLAMLVQRWVRNYMLVYQRYTNPLKNARIRQYLYEGCEGWYMPKVADAVPGFLHFSLFLFFAGLGDTLLNINTNVALSIIVPIGVSGLLYILTTFLPILFPQSPYENIFSKIFWYLFQKSHGRRFRDRGSDGEMKSVSGNFAQAQMQLAMEETEARKDRDGRAIQWLMDHLREDAKMEKFLSAIPGLFNTDWGAEVLRRMSKDRSQDEPIARPHKDITTHRPSSSRSIRSVLRPIIHLVRKPTTRLPRTLATTHSPVPHPSNVHPHSTTVHIRGKNVVHELSTRVAHSVEICMNHKPISNDDGLWRKRTRSCIEVAASLVCCTNAELSGFKGISKLLGDIGTSEKIRELSLAGTDELFVTRWTCLSLVAIRPILEGNQVAKIWASQAMQLLARADDTGKKDPLAGAQKIDETLKKASDCLFRLYNALPKIEDLTGLTEEVIEKIRGHESQISELEQINKESDRANRLKLVDHNIYRTQTSINGSSRQIISQFPGVLDDFDPHYDQPIPFSRLVELSRDPRKVQFIRPAQTLKSMCSPATTLRNILDGKGDADAYNEMLKYPEIFFYQSSSQGNGMQRQLWRLQDLCDGGGLGFTVELFFLALSQLLSTSSSRESHSALYTGTFRAITSDWSKHKNSRGTQNLLLDIAVSRHSEFGGHYPPYIVDEFILLLGNIFEGQTGPHIDKARQQFESLGRYSYGRAAQFKKKVLRVLT